MQVGIRKDKEAPSRYNESLTPSLVRTKDGLTPDLLLSNIKESKRKRYLNKKKGSKKKVNKDGVVLFAWFWDAYPKKRSKGQAFKVWQKINPSKELVIKMLKTIELFKQSESWTKEGGKYIPYPATWLNAQGWDDEYVEQDTRLSEKTKQSLIAGGKWLARKRGEND